MMFIQMKEEMFAVLECGVSRQTIELHAWGMPESIAGEKIADLMQLETPNVAILMGSAGITARITGEDEQANDSIADEIIKRWSPWFYGRGNETIAYAIGEALQGTIATAESCTAGLVSDLLAKTSGASAWFQGGWITYSNAMKVNQLGVDQRLLDEFGAVSWQVAKAMSQGATKHSGATVGVSTTGVAGPSGGSEEKPVGTVFIGCTFFGDTQVREFRFTGTRNEIRHRAASTALQMVRLLMCGECPESMCWQLGETIA
jgi:nicotinamide-nucleotide amidase